MSSRVIFAFLALQCSPLDSKSIWQYSIHLDAHYMYLIRIGRRVGLFIDSFSSKSTTSPVFLVRKSEISKYVNDPLQPYSLQRLLQCIHTILHEIFYIITVIVHSIGA